MTENLSASDVGLRLDSLTLRYIFSRFQRQKQKCPDIRLHTFLFGEDKEFDSVDISQRPKTYFPHRTKANLGYSFGDETKVSLKKIQIEIDLTLEYRGKIGVFEAKNGKPNSFSVYQIYHPFLYYHNACGLKNIGDKIKEISCVYVVRRKEKGISILGLWWEYTFDNPFDITSIRLLKNKGYKLVSN